MSSRVAGGSSQNGKSGRKAGSNGARPIKLKTSFKLAQSLTPIYTGGAFATTKDEQKLFTTLGEQVVCTEIASGQRMHIFRGDSSDVTTLAVADENAAHSGILMIAHRSLAIRLYSIGMDEGFALSRQIARAHDAPITVSTADPTGSIFATGSADGIVKVWDAAAGHCTHVFRGHGGVVSALFFDVHAERPPRLVSASDDCRIRVWDLNTRKCLHVLDGHSSVVRGVSVTEDGMTLVGGGRDRILTVWDLPSGKLRQSVPVYETLEGIGMIKASPVQSDPSLRSKPSKGKGKATAIDKQILVWTAGDSGRLRIWDVVAAQEVVSHHRQPSTSRMHEISHVFATENTVITAHVDQILTLHRKPSLRPYRNMIGFNDEVIDTLFLRTSDLSSSATHLAVATNSDLIRMYDLSNLNASLLSGHTDVVLCLSKDRSAELLVSGSKDRTARLWRASSQPGESEDSSSTLWTCCGIATGHLESIGAVGVAPREGQFMITASQDRTVKVWDLSDTLPAEQLNGAATPQMRALTTLKAHDKDINALDIAPNDRLLVTGSQDRSAKVFGIDYEPPRKGNGMVSTCRPTPLGVLKGHKRGVWAVRFSPVDQAIATASGDKTIKLWSLADYSCLKTFEGHSNTVLKLDFFPGGLQLASTASDGLLKIWNVHDEECVATLDNHEDKVWSLTIDPDASTIVSGGADSVISFWHDVTEEKEEEAAAIIENQVVKEQDLANYLDAKDYKNALVLALSMDQPRRLLGLLSDILSDRSFGAYDNTSSHPLLTPVIGDLHSSDIYRLLEYIRDWNARSRDIDVAQAILHIILKTHSISDILSAKAEASGLETATTDSSASRQVAKGSVSEIIDALIPYTERHYARMNRLQQEASFLGYIIAQMDEYAPEIEQPVEFTMPKMNGFHHSDGTKEAE